jgi:hypothetical protein
MNDPSTNATGVVSSPGRIGSTADLLAMVYLAAILPQVIRMRWKTRTVKQVEKPRCALKSKDGT